MYTDLIYDTCDGIASIMFNRSATKNSFSSKMYRELRDAVREAEMDPAVDLLVLKGSGGSFGSGGDLKEVLTGLSEGRSTVYAFVDDLPWHALQHARKVVISAVDGVCMAGGFIAAMLSDVIIATERSTFAIPEARFSLYDPWSPKLLTARIGANRARYMVLTAKSLTAVQASEWGLVNELVGADGLEERLAAVVAEVRTTSAHARASYKDAFRHVEGPMPYFDSVAYLHASPDALAGLEKFRTRRD